MAAERYVCAYVLIASRLHYKHSSPHTHTDDRRLLGTLIERDIMILIDVSSSVTPHWPGMKERILETLEMFPPKVKRCTVVMFSIMLVYIQYMYILVYMYMHIHYTFIYTTYPDQVLTSLIIYVVVFFLIPSFNSITYASSVCKFTDHLVPTNQDNITQANNG